MSPEISIIILTVFAGAAQGVFTFLVAGDLLGLVKGSPLDAKVLIAGAMVSLVLTLVGIGSSFFHLTHPERGIKAIRRWQSSWLSVEAILMPVFMMFVGLYAVAAYLGAPPGLRIVTGVLGVGASFALYLASGMLYASCRYIKEWNTPYTPINFAIIGLATGGVVWTGTLEVIGAPHSITLSVIRLAFLLTVAGVALKLAYYRRNRRLYNSFNIQSALGVNHPEIKLMDMGTSYKHYNTKEYDYIGFANNRGRIRRISLALLFGSPIILLTLDYMPHLKGSPGILGVIAAIFMMAGALMERWLFFVDGNHAQNLYYGSFKDAEAPNPILQSSKKGAQLPPA